MADVAFKSLSQAEQIFHDLVYRPTIMAAEKALEMAVPALLLPVVKQMEEGIIDLVSEWVYRKLVLLIDVESVALVDEIHQAAYDKASLKLKIIAIDNGVNSLAYTQARDEAVAALSRFTDIAASQ